MALLVILVLATLALLASFILGYLDGEPNVIAVMADSAVLEEMYEELPAGALPDMEAEDAILQWETNTSVDLFKTYYTGADGAVTVESSDGEKVVAPGTGNTYEFTLKNTGNIALSYTLHLDSMFQLKDRQIPLLFRMRQGDRWITGDTQNWIPVSELAAIHETNTLLRGESIIYQLEWMWPYESEGDREQGWNDFYDTVLASDSRDTELGNVTVDVSTEFLMNIQVVAEIAPEALAVFADGSPVVVRYGMVWLMTGVILTTLLWLLLLFLRRNIWLTGLVLPPISGTITLDRKDTELKTGRFTFGKTRLGRHTLTWGEDKLEICFRYHRTEEEKDSAASETNTQPALSIRIENNKITIDMRKNIRAVELYFTSAGTFAIQTAQWAAIDKKHNVYTPAGMIPAQEKKNRTPGGLTVDEHGRYGTEETIHG